MNNVFQVGGGRNFVIFNDGDLSMEPVGTEDLSFIRVPRDWPEKSETWSCDISWYFIVMDTGIVLCNIGSDEGVFCRKRSARFVEMFLNAPARKKKRN